MLQGATHVVLNGSFAAIKGHFVPVLLKHLGMVVTRLPGHFHRAPAPAFYPTFQKRSGSHTKEVNDTTARRIETGTPEGDALGFSKDLFSGWLEMETGNRLTLHYIISRQRNEGNTQALIRGWLDTGYDVRVVMPRPVMQHILRKFGFVPSYRYFPDQYEDLVEVWYLPPRREPACTREPSAAYAGTG